jgi:uncharacterized membrane protein
MPILWILSILLTVFIARDKNRSVVGWFFLSCILGPIAVLLVLLSAKTGQSQASIPRQYSGTSLSSIKAELEGLKSEFSVLSNRLNNLGAEINTLVTEEEKKPTSEPQDSITEPAPISAQELKVPQSVVSVAEKSEKPLSRKSDIEMDLGKFWLNKIGMIVFSLGVAFLLTYTLTRIGPVAKILLGYLIAAALFISGIKLEKMEKFINYGRVLLGGSWAIAYFTTYAMYHFEASKIIDSQLLALFLLAVIAFGIIAHSLRYKSEALTAITLFIGYFTSVLGDVGYFTLISAALLAAVALVMVYKMQWVRFIFLGIILTYLTHFVWVIKQISFSRVPVSHLNVENVYFLFDAGFLLIYWVLFTVAIHLIKNNGVGASNKKLAAANFLNFILFFFMAYPKFYFFYPVYKFSVVLVSGLAYLALAGIMDSIKRKELFISDVIIAISLLTLSIPLKFLPYHTIIIWFIELPFLLFAGFIFERRVYRYLGFTLSVILFLKLTFSDWWYLSENLRLFTFTISWQAFLSFAGFVSTAICFGLYRFLKAKKDTLDFEKLLENFYSGFSVAYLTIYIWEVVRPLWLTFGLSLESLLIFILGVLLLDKYIRWYALVILVLAGMRFCFYDRYRGASALQQLFLVYGPILCAFAEYFIYRRLNRKLLIPEAQAWPAKLLFFAAASLLVFAIVMYVQQAWITLGLAIVAISALFWGVKISDKHIRLYSLLILFLAAVRFSFIDTYYGLNKLFQWLFICAKSACAYAAYFIYRALDKKVGIDEPEKHLVSPLFYASSFLVSLAIFKYIKDIWVAVSFGIFGVFLFVTGFLIKDKIFRLGGFIIFGITLARVIFVDLSGLPIIYKIISFIILGILFLGISFIYTKYTTEKLDQKA